MSRDTVIEVFLARYSELRGVAAKALRHDDFIDDVMHDVYLKLIDGDVAADVPNPFGYCCTVVRNLVIDHQRSGAIQFGWPDDEERPIDGFGAAPSPETVADGRKLLARVSDALVALPVRTRQIFELHRIHGLSQREVARRFAISAALVNRLVAEADREIRRHLGSGSGGVDGLDRQLGP